MKKIIIIWFLLGIILPMYSKVITIKNQENYRSLELVTISSESPRVSAITNEHGQADVSLFKGSEEIEIRMMGYKTLTKSFNELEKTGFRSPNVDDAGKVFDSEPGSVVVPNPDLEAEYAWNAEAMYKFTDQLSLSSGIENLTDQRNRPYSSGIAGPGRNFILSFRIAF